jgi:two-component system chemotaxis response regulator CheB
MGQDSPSDHLVVVGASAGGISALMELAARLPAGFPAPMCVVQHVGANPSILPELLSSRGPHPAVHARDGQLLTPGVIHVAPPDQHLLVEGRTLRLSRGPKENHTRPAIDPLFRSAALAWGARVIGVVLSGMLDDGTAGLLSIKRRGGLAIVQDPASAEEPEMPQNAVRFVPVDYVVPDAEIGALLGRLVQQAAAPDVPAAEALQREVAINRGEDLLENIEAIAEPASLCCPDCGGALWEVQDASQLRYRCHTGHAFGAIALERAQAQKGEEALRQAVRQLAEREMLLRRMASIADATGESAQAEVARCEADRLREQATELSRMAASLESGKP